MLDHGILNVPLSKRGNIDSEIDRYKKQQAAEKEDEIAVRNSDFKSDKEHAKALWAQVNRDLIKAHAKQRGIGFSELRDTLDGYVKWSPKKAIQVLPMFIEG
ncbi:hypothetical protein [Morganella morganii]|uniref:hypothetical protein n=1 Tax=Morganella morganii TaxID=582 RepID=UPI0021CFABC1|nr:hypothetical protein [Morganella morganii]ELA9089579.1 hypothetical protein [Morganella morganii]MCU6273525.1 hypothetical protein [Morganella morganii]MCU6377815.1 hypothetical protein [Morganella morganii]